MFQQFVNGCSHVARFRPQPLSLMSAPNTNSVWLWAILRGSEESSSVLHTRGRQTQEECKKAQTHCRVNTPGESEKKEVPERRVTSLTATETVTGVLEAFFTSLFYFLFFSLLLLPPRWKGSCVVNNTVAFIHSGGPLCVLWMGRIMRGEINIRRRRIAAAVNFPVTVMASLVMAKWVLHLQALKQFFVCWLSKPVRLLTCWKHLCLDAAVKLSWIFFPQHELPLCLSLNDSFMSEGGAFLYV